MINEPAAIGGAGAWAGIGWLQLNPWAYPALEVLHIAGIAAMLGSLLLVELRVWGWGAALPAEPLAAAALKLSLGGFCVVVCSGLAMFAAHPGELLANRAFTLKMGLLMLAGCNAAAFHVRGGVARADAWARAQTALSLGLWLAVIICGRWIAYV